MAARMTQTMCAGCPSAVDALVPFDEDTMLAGCHDGLIRLLALSPDRCIGALPEPGELPVERMALSHAVPDSEVCVHGSAAQNLMLLSC